MWNGINDYHPFFEQPTQINKSSILHDKLSKLLNPNNKHTIYDLINYLETSFIDINYLHDINPKDKQPYIDTIILKTETLDILIKYGLDIFHKDDNGNTMFHRHSGGRYAGFPLNYYALNIQNNYGHTQLMCIALNRTYFYRCFYILPDLIKKSDLLIQDNSGNTILHYAISGFDDKSITAIVEKTPAIINIKNKQGKTPIYIAGQYRSLSTFNYLMKQPGIDLNAKNVWGQTIIQWLKANPKERSDLIIESYYNYVFRKFIKQYFCNDITRFIMKFI